MHDEKLKVLGPKFDYVKDHKPKWYQEDERVLDNVNRRLDDQIHRINKRAAKPGPYKPFRPPEPDGIRAAERGR